MSTSATKTYWFTIIDGKGSGPAGDGTFVVKFGGKGAEDRCRALASKSTCRGVPATAEQATAPAKVYARWVREGQLR